MSAVKFRFCELEKERGYSSGLHIRDGMRSANFHDTFFPRLLERAASRDRTNAIFRLSRETERN
jgi:hypothetical protein